MHRLVILLTAILSGAIAAASPAAAQGRVPPGCSDDQGTDRCSAEEQRRVLELFGGKPIEEHARAGDQVRRSFYVDGYGRDLLAIVFIRAPGQDPTVQVHFPAQTGRSRTAPIQRWCPAEFGPK